MLLSRSGVFVSMKKCGKCSFVKVDSTTCPFPGCAGRGDSDLVLLLTVLVGPSTADKLFPPRGSSLVVVSGLFGLFFHGT